jgi:FtsP/CotA-like multicopper oxidase with cupredoxin domain
MVEVNRTTTPGNTRWKLVDRQTGDANHGINWQFRVGDWVKIELVNEMDSDTVLITAGQRVNILLEVSNPGRWMAHCHIAEHHESGMMFSFEVAP